MTNKDSLLLFVLAKTLTDSGIVMVVRVVVVLGPPLYAVTISFGHCGRCGSIAVSGCCGGQDSFHSF